VSGIAAFIVGVAALRLRRDYLSIAICKIAVTLQSVVPDAQVLTGGPFGLQFIPQLFADLPFEKLIQGWAADVLLGRTPQPV
jgi:branched-chain amino acid transport system permease protein